MFRVFLLCLMAVSFGCQQDEDEAAVVGSASMGSVPEPAKVEPKSPPLAKHDPRFKPYVPKPNPAMDFSGVDVGDGAMEASAPSLAALGGSIVSALNGKDVDALRAVAISEREYKDRFFPITVNHPSGFGLGADLAWAELHGESSGDMQTALERFGGQGLAFVRLEVEEVVSRPKARLHRSPTLIVRDASGAEKTLVMLGSVLEHVPSGGFKVLAFRDTR